MVLTTEQKERKINAQIVEVVNLWKRDLKNRLGLKVNFSFDYYKKSYFQLTKSERVKDELFKKRYHLINGGLKITISGEKEWWLFKELFLTLLYIDVKKDKGGFDLSFCFDEAEKSLKNGRRVLFLSRALLINLIIHKRLIIPHWAEVVKKIDDIKQTQIKGISTTESEDSKITYNSKVTVVIADLETYKQVEEGKLSLLEKIRKDKEYYKSNMLAWNLELRNFHKQYSKTIPYAAAWAEIKGSEVESKELSSNDVKVTFDLKKFCIYLYGLAKRKNALLIWYNASYDTVVLANYIQENFPEWNLTFEYDPWNNKAKFRQGIFNFNNEYYLESQDLYIFFRKRLSLTARNKKLLKGEIPYDMVNATLGENLIYYYAENSDLESLFYPLALIKDYAKNDILLTFDALKQKLEILNILNETAKKEFGKTIKITSDYYGQSTTADAWVKLFLSSDFKSGVKMYPSLTQKGVNCFLRPKVSQPLYEALRLGIVAGLASHNKFLASYMKKKEDNPYYETEKDEGIFYFDINSSYPYQMTKPLPFGKFFSKPPTKEALIKRKRKILYIKSTIQNNPNLSEEEKKRKLDWLDDSVLLLDESLPYYTFYMLEILVSVADLKNMVSLFEYDNSEASPLFPIHKWKKGIRIVIPEELYNFYKSRFGDEFYKSFKVIDKLYKYQSKALAEMIEYTYYNLRVKYKKEGEKVKEEVFKLVLNSIYGKRMQRAFPTSYKFIHNSNYCEFEEIDAELDPFNGYLDPAAGSVIACRARIYLKQAEDKLFKECSSMKALYKDTDSLILSFKDRDLKKASKVIEFDQFKLGAWKLEGIFDTWFCKRNKCYLLLNQDITKTKLNKRSSLISGSSLSKYPRYKVALGGIDRKEIFNKWIENNLIEEVIDFAKTLWDANNYVGFPNWRVDEIKANESKYKTPILYNKAVCFASLKNEEEEINKDNKEILTHEAVIKDDTIYINML